jgi:hypothetical protein
MKKILNVIAKNKVPSQDTIFVNDNDGKQTDSALWNLLQTSSLSPLLSSIPFCSHSYIPVYFTLKCSIINISSWKRMSWKNEQELHRWVLKVCPRHTSNRKFVSGALLSVAFMLLLLNCPDEIISVNSCNIPINGLSFQASLYNFTSRTLVQLRLPMCYKESDRFSGEIRYEHLTSTVLLIWKLVWCLFLFLF